jgi:hypothetical protein
MSEDTLNNTHADAQFFILLNDVPWAGPTAHRVSGSDEMMNLGQRLDAPPGPLAYELRVDPKAQQPLDFPPLDWHDPAGGQPLFSRRMVQVLGQLGVGNIETYPASVVYQPTGAVLDYGVVNVIGLVEALDHTASDLIMSSRGRLIGINSMRLDPAKCQGLDLFRLREQPGTLIVSAALAKRMTEAGLTGLRLLQDHEWQPGMI